MATAFAGAPASRADQFGLPFDWPAARDDELFVTGSNAAAVRHLDAPGAWPVMATILTGPRLSGRSLLARRLAARTGGRVFDRAEARDEEEMFHAWNAAQGSRRPLLLVADAPPPAWTPRLPDLASRLAATPHVAIGEPDDAMFAALLSKFLGNRGLLAPPDLARYLLPRVERSYLAIHRIVDALDRHLLSRGGRPSVPVTRRALEEAGIIDARRPTG